MLGHAALGVVARRARRDEELPVGGLQEEQFARGLCQHARQVGPSNHQWPKSSESYGEQINAGRRSAFVAASAVSRTRPTKWVACSPAFSPASLGS